MQLFFWLTKLPWLINYFNDENVPLLKFRLELALPVLMLLGFCHSLFTSFNITSYFLWLAPHTIIISIMYHDKLVVDQKPNWSYTRINKWSYLKRPKPIPQKTLDDAITSYSEACSTKIDLGAREKKTPTSIEQITQINNQCVEQCCSMEFLMIICVNRREH